MKASEFDRKIDDILAESERRAEKLAIDEYERRSDLLVAIKDLDETIEWSVYTGEGKTDVAP